MKSPEGIQEHKDRLRARLRVQQRHLEEQKRSRDPPWWKRKEFLISTILALIALVLAVPSILPKITATYEGLNAKGVPSFKISNDGLLGLNKVSARCGFLKIDASPTLKIENLVVGFSKVLDTMSAGRTAIIICPSLTGMTAKSGSMEIQVKSRPDFSFFYETEKIPFVSDGDLSHWTPPHLY